MSKATHDQAAPLAPATMTTPTERAGNFVVALRRRWPIALLVFVLTLASAVALNANANSDACFQGQTHGHEGFLLNIEIGQKLRKSEPAVVYPFLTGDDMLSRPDSSPERYVIDMNRCEDVFAARAHPQAFAIICERVMPTIEAKSVTERGLTKRETGPRQTHFRRWWRFWRRSERLM